MSHPNSSNSIMKLLEDPSTSNWLKACLCDISMRDPVDMLNDVEVLRHVLEIELSERQSCYTIDHDDCLSLPQ